MSCSTFEYIGPVARAYRRVLESEEIKNPRMDDSERKLFYLDEIKRLEKTLKHFQQSRGYVAGQEYAMSCIKRTISKYKGEVERIENEERMKQRNEENAMIAQRDDGSRQIQPKTPQTPQTPKTIPNRYRQDGKVASTVGGRRGGIDLGGGEEN